MAFYLEQLEGAERSAQCARNDTAVANGDPIGADLAEDQNKAARRHALNDRCALELQVQHLRSIGGL
jgi:hypothetical protein